MKVGAASASSCNNCLCHPCAIFSSDRSSSQQLPICGRSMYMFTAILRPHIQRLGCLARLELRLVFWQRLYTFVPAALTLAECVT